MIDETVRCVLDEGFAPPSVRHIADRAGLTWGVVQYHFGNLDGLLMAVVDKGFGELIETLDRLPALGPATATHERVAFVVDAVWHAFSSPTSMAALEILISTRSMRDAVANTHLAEIMKTLTALGRQIGQGLDAPDATEVGNLIWATLRGLVVAQMVSPRAVGQRARPARPGGGDLGLSPVRLDGGKLTPEDPSDRATIHQVARDSRTTQLRGLAM